VWFSLVLQTTEMGMDVPGKEILDMISTILSVEFCKMITVLIPENVS
jgi:hypothetical protein